MKISSIKKLIDYTNKNRSTLKMINILLYMSMKYVPMRFTIDTKNMLIETGGVKFHMDTIEPWILHETFGQYIHDIIKTTPGKVIIDAGACFGDSALYFASKGLKVYAIEPNPNNFKAMMRNIDLNPELKKNIVPVMAALGESNGTLELGAPVKGISGGAMLGDDKYKEYVFRAKSYTLKGFMNRHGLKYADYLKMDCKGAEYYLTTEELRRIRSQIKIEYQSPVSEDKLPRLEQHMKEAGFKYKEISNHSIYCWR